MRHEPILIVEDNPVNLKLARMLLTNAGYDVECAADAEQAIEKLKTFQPALILMDIQLPGMDGLELTRRLKREPRTSGTAIVALTAYAMKGDEERVKAAGCDAYLTKPIDTRRFAAQVARFLNPAEVSAQREEAAPAGDPNDLLRELRNGFIAEGEESSRRLAEADLFSYDIDALRRIVHRWAGIGGTLGFPEITMCARNLEDLLETQPADWRQQAGGELGRIRRVFEAAVTEPNVPSLLFGGLTGKRIGIAGFDASEAGRVHAAFAQAQAIARDLGSLSDGLGMEALHAFDLIVLNACTTERIEDCESVLAQPVLEKPVLLVSSRAALANANRALAHRAVDFVLAPWDSEELLFRAQRALGIEDRLVVPSQTERKGRKPVVLIADDDNIIHALLTPMLNKLGVDCFSARDGREALETIRNVEPDAVVLDIAMPRVSGMSVLAEVRKGRESRDVPILMLTARQQKNDINMALAFGANDYVTKPFDPEDVILRISRLLPQGAALSRV